MKLLTNSLLIAMIACSSVGAGVILSEFFIRPWVMILAIAASCAGGFVIKSQIKS